MEVLVDDVPMPEPAALSGTVGDAVRHIQSNVCAAGRLVVSIRCDGLEVSGSDLAEALRRPLESLTRIEVCTSTAGTLVTDAMTRASTALDETMDGAERAAGLLTQGKTADGIEVLGECARTWQQVHQAVFQSLQMLQLDPRELEVNGVSLVDAMDQPRQALQQVKQALVAGDHVMLADVLQYEFSEAMQTWLAIIARVHREAEERGEPGA
ncbi:MAG: hypothetical protein HY763_05765 [Planctomycetes bacterium]|nr:hypothetical protein [Planctomycetota bacterium]